MIWRHRNETVSRIIFFKYPGDHEGGKEPFSGSMDVKTSSAFREYVVLSPQTFYTIIASPGL